jgi:hypothetical protein
MTAAYLNGLSDGQAARAGNQGLSAYQRVGIDDYAKGFRAGFYGRAAASLPSERNPSLHVVKL